VTSTRREGRVMRVRVAKGRAGRSDVRDLADPAVRDEIWAKARREVVEAEQARRRAVKRAKSEGRLVTTRV